MKLTLMVIIKKITLICSLLIVMLSYAQAVGGINANWINSGSGGLMSLSRDEPLSKVDICNDRKTPYYFYLIFADDSPPKKRFYLKSVDPTGKPSYYDSEEWCAGILRKLMPGTLTVTVPISSIKDASFVGIAPSTRKYNDGYLPSGIPFAQGWLKGNTGDGTRPPNPEEPKPSCSAGDVSINYGSLAPADVHGKKETKNLVISCTEQAKVKVYTNTNTVSLRTSLTAKLLVNDQTATTGILANVSKDSATRIPVTSELNYSGTGNPASGDFSGTAVIHIEIQ